MNIVFLQIMHSDKKFKVGTLDNLKDKWFIIK